MHTSPWQCDRPTVARIRPENSRRPTRVYRVSRYLSLSSARARDKLYFSQRRRNTFSLLSYHLTSIIVTVRFARYLPSSACARVERSPSSRRALCVRARAALPVSRFPRAPSSQLTPGRPDDMIETSESRAHRRRTSAAAAAAAKAVQSSSSSSSSRKASERARRR